jgi:mycoredoxin
MNENPSNHILLYGRRTCPSVPPVLRLLDEAGAAYEYVDVRQDFDAAARLRQITGGYESVPTLVFPDGRTLVEPGTAALRRALQEAGPAGGQPVSTAATIRAALSNPVYWVMALIALALVVAIIIQ